MAAVPYYRDDSCFDDGTGTDPGPKLHLALRRRAADPSGRHAAQVLAAGRTATPPATAALLPGHIGTHGLHLLFLADSDNARQTVPLTEIVSDWRLVMLPGSARAPRASSTAAASRSRSSPSSAPPGSRTPGQYRYGDSNPGFRRERAAS